MRARSRARPGAPVTALRYHNVYGPRMPRDTPYAGVATHLPLARWRPAARRACSRTAASGATSCTCATSPRANVLALTTPASPGAFNVASGTPRSVGDMAARARPRGGRRLAPVVTGEWRAGDVRHVFASPERAASELGFRAVEDFEAGMREFARGEAARMTPIRRRRPRRVDRVRARSRTCPSRARSSTRPSGSPRPAGSAAVAAVQLAKLSGDVDFFTALGDDERGRRAARAAGGARRARPRRAARGACSAGASSTSTTTASARSRSLGERHRPARRRRPAVGARWTAPTPSSSPAATTAAMRAGAPRAAARRHAARRRHRCATGIQLDALVGSAQGPGEQQADADASTRRRDLVVTTAGKEGGDVGRRASTQQDHWKAAELPGPRATPTAPATRSPAGLTYALGAGMDTGDALQLAARCGAHKLTGRAAYDGQLTADEL